MIPTAPSRSTRFVLSTEGTHPATRGPHQQISKPSTKTTQLSGYSASTYALLSSSTRVQGEGGTTASTPVGARGARVRVPSKYHEFVLLSRLQPYGTPRTYRRIQIPLFSNVPMTNVFYWYDTFDSPVQPETNRCNPDPLRARCKMQAACGCHLSLGPNSASLAPKKLRDVF